MSDLVELRTALYQRRFADISHSLPVKKLLLVCDIAYKRPDLLEALLKEDDCRSRLSASDYATLIHRLSLELDEHAFSKALRILRHQQLFRLYLRELASISTTEETTYDWSNFADAIIMYTLQYCEKQMQKKYGTPCDEDGSPVSFFPIAMGKLGGHELNFSSDIDLIFAFSKSGYSNGTQQISNQEYFTRIIQLFMQLLHNVTKDGFVFRVDLRLRPYGESGPLAGPLSAMETYYQEQGRDWERYAMVKARLIHGEKKGRAAWFNRLIKPFVYRRYVDFSVIESLRSMKAMIEREINLNPMLDDVKRGRGGIREVEFIIQSFQLMRGGRLPQLQHCNAMHVLRVLQDENLLKNVVALEKAYWFLRKLENALQARNDQQTHSLPTDEVFQFQIALAMGFDTWESLFECIKQHRSVVHEAFIKVLGKADIYEDDKRLRANQLNSIWQGHVEPSLAKNLLASINYHNPKRCYQMLHAFRQSARCRRLSQTARMRLDRFMILLLNELTHVDKTDEVLLHVLHLLENIVGRSVYLALLIENPHVLQELLYWFSHSPFITSLLVNQPFLLEVLIDQEITWKPLSKEALRINLQDQLKHCRDEEVCNETLRQFKLTCWLLAARAEYYEQFDAVEIAQFLADVAETIIVEVLAQASRSLKSRYPEMDEVVGRFAIIAYGKLGAREMNYNSDVDLVFLHSAKPSQEGMVVRLTQKILHSLTLRSQTGILYSVDTRLRPSGSAGLLVSPIDAFDDYQRNQAWTWEHQALLRARVIFANHEVCQWFSKLRQDVLSHKRDREKLAKEVQDMRHKINVYTEKDAIKHASGGLLDLEFLVQYLCLVYPYQNLIQETNTLMQLEKLFKQKVLSPKEHSTLVQAYRQFHQAMHLFLLQSTTLDVESSQKRVKELCKKYYNVNSF